MKILDAIDKFRNEIYETTGTDGVMKITLDRKTYCQMLYEAKEQVFVYADPRSHKGIEYRGIKISYDGL